MELKSASEIRNSMPKYKEWQKQQGIHQEYVKRELIETIEAAAKDNKFSTYFIFDSSYDYNRWEYYLTELGYKVMNTYRIDLFERDKTQAYISWE